jgi:MFS family permease
MARAISSVGDRFAQIALYISVFDASGSALTIGGLVAITAFPPLVMGPYAGYLAQMMDRRWLMAITSFISAGLTVTLIWLAPVASPLVFPVVLALALADAVFRPAFRAALTDLTADAERDEVNAATELAQEAPDIAGYLAGGAVVAAAGPAVAFAIDSASFLFAGVTLLGIGVQRGALGDGPPESVLAMTRRGIRAVFTSPSLRPLMIGNFLVTVGIAALIALGVVVARQLLATDAFGYGLLETLLGAGKIVGGLIVATVAARLGRSWSYALGCVGLGIGFAIVAISRSYPLTASVYVALGLFNLLYTVPFWSMIQRHTPSFVVGPVMAFNNAVVHLAVAGGAILAGLYSDQFTPTATLLGAALVTAAAGLYVGVKLSDVERVLVVAPQPEDD